MSPRFISAGPPSFSRSSLKRSFPFCDYLPHSGTSGSAGSYRSRKVPRSISQSDSSRASSHSHSHSHRDHIMSSLPVAIPHHRPVKADYPSTPQQTETSVQRAATMELHDDYNMAPLMKATASSSGSSISDPVHSSIGFVDEPFLPITTVGMAHSMTSSDTMWAMTAPSFDSSTDDTPSVSSSFDYMDFPKQENNVCQGLPLYSASPDCQATERSFYLPAHDQKIATSSLTATVDDMSWSKWPIPGLTEPWPQEVAPDGNIWTPTGYLSSCWSGQEPLDNPSSTINPATQTLYPPQTTTTSSLSHPPYLKFTSPLVSSAQELDHHHSQHEYPRTSSPQPHCHSQPQSNPQTQPTLSPIQPNQPQNIQPSQIPPAYSIEPTLPCSPDARTNLKANLQYSDTRNAFLIECKRRGLSYKDIKRLGGFKEAESTLRGRFRTLTKAKEQRVRKPKWHDRDVSDSKTKIRTCLTRDPLRSDSSVKQSRSALSLPLHLHLNQAVHHPLVLTQLSCR